MKWYKLDEQKNPYPVDLMELGPEAEMPIEERRVACDEIGDVVVSTVFLQLDHNYTLQGAPVLFETMVFGGDLDGEAWRYCTWWQAEEGHQEIVEKVMVKVCN